MSKPLVLIAGGGIGGLATALTLHQIGVPCRIFEAVTELQPLGVGINLQPNGVRELFDLGIGPADLDRIGISTKEWALVGLNGAEIYAEPRGRAAGYHWPQYSVHRGRLQMLLLEKVLDRLGPEALCTGQRVTGYDTTADGVSIRLTGADGTETQAQGTLLIGADGIHSAIRAQMHPDQPPIHWGGAIMWRGTTRARPIRTGASFVGLGTHRHRLVFYPISQPDSDGLAEINWIAEVTVDNSDGWKSNDWTKKVAVEDFLHHFAGWSYDWLDVPQLITRAGDVWEYPMVDRDPVPFWTQGPVTLLGDAAHVMYPTGSNGATQAIVDARVLGAEMVAHGVNQTALAAYGDRLCGPVSDVVLRNRSAGPFGLLTLVDDRCGGTFEDIDSVIPAQERQDFMMAYKSAAGFAMEKLNAAAATIDQGSQVDMNR